MTRNSSSPIGGGTYFCHDGMCVSEHATRLSGKNLQVFVNCAFPEQCKWNCSLWYGPPSKKHHNRNRNRFPTRHHPPTSSHWYKLYDPVGTFPAKHSDEVRLNWKAPVGLIIDGPARHATLDNDEIENHLTHGCEVDADRPHSSSSAGSGSDSRPKL